MKILPITIGIGAGGHAKVLLDILLELGQYNIIGLLDSDPVMRGNSVFGVSILGDDAELDSLIANNNITAFFLGVGAVKSLKHRRKLYEDAISKRLIPIDIIHPASHISSHALLGSGITVMAGAIINASSRIGENVIINTGAIVEHDCLIGSHVHIATGARLAGGVAVGDESLIGAGSVIRQGIKIGKRVIVGAGSVIVKNVSDDCIVVGNPARVLLGK